MPTIIPLVCLHTYCSNQAKARMNPKTMHYLVAHSDINVTLNIYTHLWLEDSADEHCRMEEAENARRERESSLGRNSSLRNCSEQFNPENSQSTLPKKSVDFFVEKYVMVVYINLLIFDSSPCAPAFDGSNPPRFLLPFD